MNIRIPYTSILFLATILLNLAPASLRGQKQTYEELIAGLNALTKEQAFTRLFEHQAQNPQFANTYVQLGYLSERFIEELDAFRSLQTVYYHIDNAVLYYELFPHYLQSNDVRKYKELYSNIPIEKFGFPFSNDGMLAYAKSRVEYCKKMKENLNSLYKALEKSKNHYNSCVEIFNTISTSYENYNELLLRANPQFLSQVNLLETEFNAAIKEFNAYKALLKQFPIQGYNQNFKLLPIKTFRLDGITNSDFLKEQFTLWDYSDWVTQFRSTYNNEILPLRAEIESIQKLFDENMHNLSAMEYAQGEMDLKSFDEAFLFKLGRFDSNSLVRELFNYSQKRQNYLLATKNPLNNPNDSSLVLLNRKLRYYFRLSQDLSLARVELENYRKAISPDRINRFADFFSTYYNGKVGLEDYYTNQADLLEGSHSQALGRLSAYLQNETARKRSFLNAQGAKGVSVPLVVLKPENITDQHVYVTQDVQYANNQPAYVSGYTVRGKLKVPFVAKITVDLKVEWIKEVELNDKALNKLNRSAAKLFAYEQGVVAVVSAEEAAPQEYTENNRKFVNTIVHLNSSGNPTLFGSTSCSNLPIMIQFDEINKVTHMAFGMEMPNQRDTFTKITIAQADSTGTVVWQTDLDVKGNLAGFVRSNDNYIAYMNFQEFNINGQTQQSENNGMNWALVATELSTDGKVSKVIPFVSSDSFFIDRVVPLSSTEVTLIGYSDLTGDLKYFVLSTSGDIIVSNSEL